MEEPEVITRQASVESANSFTELVRDHADLVYSAARRQLGDSAMAEDVMQAVFILLWRKAGSIRGSVAGWLVKATYLACCDARKLAARRKYHERAAAMIKPEHSDIGTEAGWENYAKALDEAIVRLRAKDRNAVALRYLRGLSFREVGLAMGIGEDAAKKRVGRAIGRLREIMMSRKVAVPVAGVLATQMEMRCIEAAPRAMVTAMAASAGSEINGTFAAMIARRSAMRGTWVGAKISAIILLLLGMTAWSLYLAIQGGPAEEGVTPAVPGITLNIRAMIDGSDVLNITSAGAAWTHTAWQWPTGIRINGENFDTHAQPTLERIGLADADLSSAEVKGRSGRGTVAVEKTDAGIAIHFSDPQSGAAPYAITIRFAPGSTAPNTLATTLPSADAILLDVKATIAGGDVLAIDPQGANWRHMNMEWPSDVTVNGQKWDVRSRPFLADIGLTDADLSSAQMVGSSGRDTVAMEKTAGGVAIYFSDAVGGAAPYEIKIRFSHIK